MDVQRIKNAKINFDNYILDGLLIKTKFNKNIFDKYIENSLESLEVANTLFDKNSYLWVIVCSYYSMFYIANAFLLFKGYKISHKIVHQVVNDALIVFLNKPLEDYEETKENALSLIYTQERKKRSVFQYEMSIELKEAKSKTSLERAKEFVQQLRTVLNINI